MGFYKVKKNRSIKIGDITFLEGELVELTASQLRFHAENVALTDYPLDDSSAELNFEIAKGSDLSKTIGLGTKTLEIVEFQRTNPFVIKTEADHGLVTGGRIFVHAFRNTSLNKDVLLSKDYLITKITNDTFSIQVDGTTIAIPQLGYVDYIQDIAQSAFQCFIYEPKKDTKQVVTKARFSTTSGSRFVSLKSGKEASIRLAVGQRITIENALSNAEIQSIDTENATDETVLLVETPATATLTDAFGFSEYDEYDPTLLGPLVKTVAVPQDNQLGEIVLSIKSDLAMTLDNYIYRVIETKNGISDMILRGLIVYV
jgi:hypothetical protein